MDQSSRRERLSAVREVVDPLDLAAADREQVVDPVGERNPFYLAEAVAVGVHDRVVFGINQFETIDLGVVVALSGEDLADLVRAVAGQVVAQSLPHDLGVSAPRLARYFVTVIVPVIPGWSVQT